MSDFLSQTMLPFRHDLSLSILGIPVAFTALLPILNFYCTSLQPYDLSSVYVLLLHVII